MESCRKFQKLIESVCQIWTVTQPPTNLRCFVA